ncbi:hypothetical protein ACYULU_01055 [Breznakiellaceae bacterium SP9]
MGIFSGIVSAISSAVSSVCSAVGSVCSAIGLGSIGTALTAAITALNPVIGLIIAAIPLVTKVLGLLAPKEVKPEEIESGRLAVMAEECSDIKPENYDSTSAWIKAIRDDIEKNPEKEVNINDKIKNLNDSERSAYQLVSVGIAGKLAGEKLKTDDIDPVFLAKANAMDLGAEGTISLIKGIAGEGVSTSDVNKYFDGSLSGEDYKNTAAAVKSVLEQIDPSLNTEDKKNSQLNTWSEKIDAAVEKTKAEMEGVKDET